MDFELYGMGKRKKRRKAPLRRGNCRKGRVINPKTGRCIKKSGPTYRKLKGLPAKKKRAPVRRRAPIRRRREGNYHENLPMTERRFKSMCQKLAQKCPSGQRRSMKTGLCRDWRYLDPLIDGSNEMFYKQLSDCNNLYPYGIRRRIRGDIDRADMQFRSMYGPNWGQQFAPGGQFYPQSQLMLAQG